MTTKAFRFSTFLLVIFLAVLACGFELMATAQDQNNQNTAAADTTTKKATTARRRNRRRRAAKAATAADAASTPVPAETPAVATTETAEQTDLSGTYSGTFDCSDAGVTGPATLTITGNQFTLADGKTGHIVATTTHGYTGVAMQFGEVVMASSGHPAGPPPVIVSMRARKAGDRLTLTTVPGAMHVCSFTPAGSMARTRHRRARTVATPATPAEPPMPAAAETPATTPETATPTTPARRTRRGRRNTNTNMNTNSNMNDNTGAAEGNMNATPTPTPGVPRH